MQDITLDSLWRRFEVQNNESLCIRLGPLTLVIRHEKNEWSLAYLWNHEQDIAEPIGTLGNAHDFSNIQDNMQRYAYTDDNNTLYIRPRLADRSIVARPRSPFYLVARQKLWLYVSSPIWLQVVVGEDNTQLMDIPIHRPSDTWFGSNTMEGEVAYATRTHARLSLEEVIYSRHRAVTPLELVNNTDKHLLLERISLPVPLLYLFADQDHNLWTSAITMVRENGNGSTSIKIEPSAPGQIATATLLSNPRKETVGNVFSKTLQVLFG